MLTAQSKCSDLKAQFPTKHQDSKVIEVSTFIKAKDVLYSQDVLKVMEQLLKTSENEKTIFGQFKSPIVKEWFAL